MISDTTQRERKTGIPIPVRSVLELHPFADMRPSYTFFFTAEDTGPEWPSFENPEVLLAAPETATLKRSSELFDAWVLQHSQEFVVCIQGLVPVDAPWSIVIMEDAPRGPSIEVRTMTHTREYRVIKGLHGAPPLELSPIRYLDDGKLVPVLEVENLLALMIWPTMYLPRTYIEHLFWKRPGGFFHHIWFPSEQPRHRSGVSNRVTGGCT